MRYQREIGYGIKFCDNFLVHLPALMLSVSSANYLPTYVEPDRIELLRRKPFFDYIEQPGTRLCSLIINSRLDTSIARLVEQ